MCALRVSLFSKLYLQCGVDGEVDLASGRAHELFCYLLLHRQQAHHRETLADLLWGDTSPTQAKAYLRKALWQLHTALEVLPLCRTPPIVQVERDWVYINSTPDLWLDVDVFEQAYTQVQDVPGTALDAQSGQLLQRAVDLYHGDLLAGWYQDWCLFERERFQYMYLAMLDKLMDFAEAQHAYESGLVYGQRALRYDPARERTHRRMMRLLYWGGYRTAALRQYARCVVALDDEFGVQPAKRTVALYAQMRADQVADPTAAPASDDREDVLDPPPQPRDASASHSFR